MRGKFGVLQIKIIIYETTLERQPLLAFFFAIKFMRFFSCIILNRSFHESLSSQTIYLSIQEPGQSMYLI
jgi:hypothetical protein